MSSPFMTHIYIYILCYLSRFSPATFNTTEFLLSSFHFEIQDRTRLTAILITFCSLSKSSPSIHHRTWQLTMPQNDDAQNDNIAFTLLARNDVAQKIWADERNSSRYTPFSQDWQGPSTSREQPGDPNYSQRSEVNRQVDTERALQFRFSEKPKDYKKGFQLGSRDETCDVVLGSSPDFDPEMVAFTYNAQNELIMNVTSIQHTTVEFNDQPSASRQRFSWILPRGQKMIRVTVAKDAKHELVFDVVLPPYDPDSIDEYHKNCKPFVIPGVGETLIAEAFSVDNTAARTQGGVAFKQASPFYLRKEKLGNGSFGVVRKVQRMPDGKMFAAKAVNMPDPTVKDLAAKRLESDGAFKEEAEKAKKAYKKQVEKVEKAFRKEVEVLKQVSKPTHVGTQPINLQMDNR